MTPPSLLGANRRHRPFIYLLVAIFLSLTFAQHASAGELEFDSETIIFKPKPGISDTAIARTLQGEGPVKTRRILQGRNLRRLNLQEMSDERAMNLSQQGKAAKVKDLSSLTPEKRAEMTAKGREMRIRNAIAKLKASGLVEYAEPDYILELHATPNDPLYSELWGMSSINAPAAWDVRTDSSPILVGIVDSGVNYKHNDLKNNVWANPGEIANNGIDDDNNGYIDDIYGIDLVNGDSDPNDDNSHGSHVAGTIGAQGNNNLGVAGVAWTARMIAAKSFDNSGRGKTSNSILAIDYLLKRGVKVINNSWSGRIYSQALADVVAEARQQGVIMVCAAGNSGSNIDISPTYPASLPYDNVVTVGAIASNGSVSSFSSFGMKTNIFAPGTAVLSTVEGQLYDSYDGTSMATPHVAGALALVWAQHPGENYRQVINRLHNGGSKASAYNNRSLTGAKLDVFASLSASVRPLNDDYAGRTRINSAEVELSPVMEGATLQSGEPSHPGNPTSGTIWYAWTPGRSTSSFIEVRGGDNVAMVAIYTGSSLTNLSLVASNYSPTSGYAKKVEFTANSSTTYLVAVALANGKTPANTNVALKFSSPPVNDNFADAINMGSGYTADHVGSNIGATTQTGEPLAFVPGALSGATVWYRWTAPMTRYCEVSTIGEGNFDSVLGVFTGTDVANLTLIGGSDDFDPNSYDSKVGFLAVAGQVYHISVGGYLGDRGGFKVELRCDTENRPPFAKIVSRSPSPTQPMLVSFEAAGAVDLDGSVVSATWEFGDGGTGSGLTATHHYGSSGIYPVRLTLTDNEGATSIFTQNVTLTREGLVIIDGAEGYWKMDETYPEGPILRVPNELLGPPANTTESQIRGMLELSNAKVRDQGYFSRGAVSFEFPTVTSVSYARILPLADPDSNERPLIPKQKTIAAWVKMDGYRPNSNNTALLFYNNYDKRPIVTLNNSKITFTEDGPDNSKSISAQGFVVGEWQHLAVTYDLATMRIFLNGNQVAQTSYVVPPTYRERGGVSIGTYPKFFSGLLDEMYIFPRALSASEVKGLMNQGIKAPTQLTAPLVESSRVDLAWTDASTNEEAFVVQRKLSTESTFVDLAVLPENATSYSDTSIQPNRTATYRVIGRNIAFNSGPSNEVTVTTPFAAQGNLAYNPGFENGTADWLVSGGKFEAIEDAATAPEGSKYLRVYDRGSNTGTARQNVLPILNFNGTGSYSIGAQVWLGTAGNIVARLRYRDGDTWKNATLTRSGNAGWNAISGQVTVLWSDLKEAYLEIYSSSNKGEYRLDAVSLEKVPAPPAAATTIRLSANKVAENQTVGKKIGTLSAVDSDPGDVQVYSVVGENAGLFAVQGNVLVTNAVLHFEQAASRLITIRATDSFGLSYDRQFTIEILNSSHPVVSQSSVKLWHRYEGDLQDSSGNENHGILLFPNSNFPVYGPSDRDGTQAFVSANIGHRLQVDTALFKEAFNERTVACWIKSTDTLAHTILFDHGASSGLAIQIRNNTLEVAAGEAMDKAILSIPFNSKEWTHVAVTYHFGELTLFLNGVMAARSDTFGIEIPAQTTAGNIGSRNGEDVFGAAGSGFMFRGSVDDLRVYSAALPPALIVRVMNGEPPINLPPSDITLSNSTIQENENAGTLVGVLSAIDPTASDTHTFTLSGADAAAFSIVGNELRSAQVFDFETKSSYRLTVRATDQGGLFLEKEFIITILNVFEGEQDFVINPVADAYVRDGSFANTNFGTNDRLEVKPTASFRQSFLRFDLGIIPAGMDAATGTIELVVASVEGGVTPSSPVGVSLYLVNDVTWGETTLTWNNRPTPASLVGTVNVGSVGQVVTFDVTEAVRTRLASDRQLSLALIGASGTKVVSFMSREGITKPALKVRTIPTSTPQTYEQWRDTLDWGSTPIAQRGPNDNPDGDPYSNAMERALGGSPTTVETNLAPMDIQPQPEGRWLLTQWYSKAQPHLVYEMVWSTDLVTWFTDGVSEENFDAATGMYYRTYLAPIGTAKIFGRLRVTQP